MKRARAINGAGTFGHQSSSFSIRQFSVLLAVSTHAADFYLWLRRRDVERFHNTIDARKEIKAGADPTPRSAASVRRGMTR
jgi:hypothetical protein